MPDHAAFLRGINLGHHRRVGKADLRACFEGIGFGEVGTFRASGNVLFAAGDGSPDEMKARIGEAGGQP